MRTQIHRKHGRSAREDIKNSKTIDKPEKARKCLHWSFQNCSFLIVKRASHQGQHLKAHNANANRLWHRSKHAPALDFVRGTSDVFLKKFAFLFKLFSFKKSYRRTLLSMFATLQLQTPHIQLPKDAQFIPLLDLAFTSARSSMRVLKTSGPCTGLTLNMPKRQTGKHVNWNSQKASEPWIQSHEKVSWRDFAAAMRSVWLS